MTTRVPVWRFIRAGRRLGYGDGREIREGEMLAVDGEPVPCERGIHGSDRLTDALGYCWQRPILTAATLHGAVVRGDDKLCASHCTTDRILTQEETDKFLRLFAVRCARRVLRHARKQDCATLENTLDVAERYAHGKATDKELAAASDAASAAAWAAASDAAWSASAAAWAASDAASDAAWTAAWAASDAASDAAWTAARAARAAAWAAAWAASDAERNEQEAIANELWTELFERDTRDE